MFLTQGQVERGHFTNNRYGTAGTTTTTTLASSGGLLVNIDSATGDIARTTAGDLENNSALGIYARQDVVGWSVEADTAVTRTGTKTLKISTTSVAGAASCIIGADNREATFAGTKNRLYPLKASTKYKATCWAKTSGVASGAVFLTSWEWNSTYTGRVFNVSNALTGTNDWTLLTLTFTTNAATVWGTISVANSVAGNISDAWFDINSMTLEEVVEPVANSLTSSSPSLVSFTAVGSTDNIDQSQLTNTANYPLGDLSAIYFGQQFLPSKSKLTGVVIQKHTTTGTYTGNITVAIVNDNAGVPGSTILASSTIANATWTALSVGVDYTVNLPCNLTVNGSTKYWIRLFSSTSDAANYARIKAVNPSGYASGGIAYGTDGVAYPTTSTNDLYFKTLYYKPTTNFKASQNNSTVSISADEDGFLDGSVYNLTTGTATFTETFGTFYLLQYTESGSDLIAEVNLPGVGLSASFTSDRTLEYSSDGVTYGASFPTGYSKVWVKILAYSGFASFSYSIQFSTASINTLRNYPTNKDIIKQYSTTLGSPTTSATYRATKWGFPAIEYSSTEYQFLDVDTTATGSTVAFSELGTSYTTVADGASLTITSTSTPNIFVKANITANRLYLSSNDYNASSDKDGSMKQSCTYQVIQ